MKILNLMTSAAFVLCATSAAISTPVNAATQSLAAAGYTFSYDDSFWGISGGTTFSNIGDVFTFANLGYAVSASGWGGTGQFIDRAGSVVTVTANSGYVLEKIATQARGYYSVAASNVTGASAEAVTSLTTTWLTDNGSSYSGSQGKTTSSADHGESSSGTYTVFNSYNGGETLRADVGIEFFGKVAVNGNRSSASISMDSVSFTVTSSSVSPVPEPESYAMLVAGLGLLGAVARRRKPNSNA